MTGASYIDAVIGQREGFVALAFGRVPYWNDKGRYKHKDWSETRFRWPSEMGKIAIAVDQELATGEPVDIYVCPAVRFTNDRRKGSALPPMVCWADLDGPPADAALWDTLNPLVVDSGQPGHRHAYVPLTKPVGLGVHARLNMALADRLGGDAKWSDESLLRMPGSLNFKSATPSNGEPAGKPSRVLAQPWSGTPWDPGELAEILGVDLEQSGGTKSSQTVEGEPVDVDNLPTWLRDRLDDKTKPEDASEAFHGLVGACRDAKLTQGQAVTVMGSWRHLPDRYTRRVAAEVARSWGKVEERRPATDETTGLELPDGHRATDVGNAARLLEQAGGQLHYVHAWGKWIVYQRGRWTLDENDALVTEQGKHVAKALFALAAKATDKDERKAIWSWALRSEASGSIAAMVRLARGIPGVLVEHEDLDADPYLLNVRNGTIDLRTGQLRPHDPADLITVQCPVSYDPHATAPLWKECVERWQPDAAVRKYVQVRAGAGTTGHPTETVDVDYGSGSNGKSKFWGAVQHVLGDYAVVPHKSLLVAQRHEQHDTVKARLFRKRLAVASETKAADTLDDEQVKNLTGGDRLQGRRMREDPWEFNPTHTLVMFSNHKPAVQGRDEGIWRRLRLVPWAVTIPEKERDDDLARKLRAEAPGILRWLVDGARSFIAEGLTPPAVVRAATDAYRNDEDVVGRFVAEVLYFTEHGWAWSAEIRSELEAWCTDQGVEPTPSMNDVAAVLKENGCASDRLSIRGRRGVIWRGVAIVDHTPSEQGER